MIFILIIIAAAVALGLIIYFVMEANRQKETDDKDRGKSKLKLGDEYTSENLKSMRSTDHTTGDGLVKILYAYRSDEVVWICPNCEVENREGAEKCMVCYARRK